MLESNTSFETVATSSFSLNLCFVGTRPTFLRKMMDLFSEESA